MPLVSIDFTKKQIEAVRTCQGQPEERQVLLCGPDGMGVCTWQDGGAYESDVPNLTISSREAAKVVAPKERPAGKTYKPAKKAKQKAAAKAKASANDDDGSDDEDESSEEEAEEVEDKGGLPAEEGKGAAEGGPVEPKGAEVPQDPEDEPPADKPKQA